MELDEVMRLLSELHEGLPRQGPGSSESTLRALSLTGATPAAALRILDVGCGSGAQTVTLAEVCSGHITAVDTHPPFLDALARRVKQRQPAARVDTLCASMDALDFPDATFDLIWSEGAIYIMGFEAGLKAWRPMVKPGGFVAVSELTWLTETPPEEPARYWSQEYPAMTSVKTNLERIAACGYHVIDYFLLPESCWKDEYYAPLRQRIDSFRAAHADSTIAQELCDATLAEMALYEKHSNVYGYVFYVMKRA